MNILDFIDLLETIDLTQIKRVSRGDLAFLFDMCNNIANEAKRVLDKEKENKE